MLGTRRSTILRAAAAVAALTLGASGCWLQRGFAPTRNGYIAGTAPITPENADQLVQLWRTSVANEPPNDPVVFGDDVFVTGGHSVSRLSASTGAVRYNRTITDPDTGTAVQGLSAPAYRDGELLVGWSASHDTPSGGAFGGGLARLVPASGALVAPLTFDRAVRDIAIESGGLATQNTEQLLNAP